MVVSHGTMTVEQVQTILRETPNRLAVLTAAVSHRVGVDDVVCAALQRGPTPGAAMQALNSLAPGYVTRLRALTAWKVSLRSTIFGLNPERRWSTCALVLSGSEV